ncbi:hypothetical protein EWH99_05200 [Sporolactobacillus sp. THM7-7]|nr:hypothetical protein EWH99_05200 [Sporolactobacillus sp. THM7-7]
MAKNYGWCTEMVRYYLGIDGGGTKTDAVLFSSEGGIVQRVIGAGTNPNSIHDEQVTERFQDIFLKLMSHNRPDSVTGCFAGLAGSDHPAITRKLARCIRQACPVPIDHLQVGNDAMNALWSGTEGGPGLVVIAGTGSIAYGMQRNGKDFRIGGWGYLFGDEGSGYDIGREAIRCTLMSYDGRKPKTQLTAALENYFKVDAIADIVPIIYRCSKNVIAGLAPHVETAALRGDQLAHEVMSHAARSLILLIRSGMRRFNEDIEVVLTGGVWESSIIREMVSTAIQRAFIFPKHPPVYGSIAKCCMEWEKAKSRLILENVKKQIRRE